MPTFSARTDIAVRVCVCSVAASLFADAVWPSDHVTDPVHVSAAAEAIGSALMLSLLFACVWEPLKERVARWLLPPSHSHGELVGLPALLLMILLGAGLVWVHTVLHHHFDLRFGDAVGATLERGPIVAIVCAFWFSAPAASSLRIVLAVSLVAVIALVGQALLRAGITHEAWTPSEIVWTVVPCAALLLARGYFQPWTTESSLRAGRRVAATGLAVIALTAIVHGLDRFVPLPSPLLYSSTVTDPHDWAGTMLDDLFFYGGWAAGLLIAPDISPKVQPADPIGLAVGHE